MAFESVKKVAEADFPTRWGAFAFSGLRVCCLGAARTANHARQPRERWKGWSRW